MARTKQTARKHAEKTVAGWVRAREVKTHDSTAPRRYRLRPGTAALREIKREQRRTKSIIPRANFRRVVKEVAQEHRNKVLMLPEAYAALQTAAEAHLVELFADAQMLAINSERETILRRDLVLVRIIRGELPRSSFIPPPPRENSTHGAE